MKKLLFGAVFGLLVFPLVAEEKVTEEAKKATQSSNPFEAKWGQSLGIFSIEDAKQQMQTLKDNVIQIKIQHRGYNSLNQGTDGNYKLTAYGATDYYTSSDSITIVVPPEGLKWLKRLPENGYNRAKTDKIYGVLKVEGSIPVFYCIGKRTKRGGFGAVTYRW